MALPLVSQMALLPQSPLVLWKVTVLWSSLMMTARFRPVLALAFRHTPHHLRRRPTFCLVSYWRLMGRACCLGLGQSMRRERKCVLGLCPSKLTVGRTVVVLRPGEMTLLRPSCLRQEPTFPPRVAVSAGTGASDTVGLPVERPRLLIVFSLSP